MRALMITYDTEALYPLYRLWEEWVEVDIPSFEKKTFLKRKPTCYFLKQSLNL